MPNNLQILAYVKAMQDRTSEGIKYCEEMRLKKLPVPGSNLLKGHLSDLCNLEKFIRGEK